MVVLINENHTDQFRIYVLKTMSVTHFCHMGKVKLVSVAMITVRARDRGNLAGANQCCVVTTAPVAQAPAVRNGVAREASRRKQLARENSFFDRTEDTISIVRTVRNGVAGSDTQRLQWAREKSFGAITAAPVTTMRSV